MAVWGFSALSFEVVDITKGSIIAAWALHVAR